MSHLSKNHDVEYILSKYIEYVNSTGENKSSYNTQFKEYLDQLQTKIKALYLSKWDGKCDYNVILDYFIDELDIKFDEELINNKKVVKFYYRDPISMIYKELTTQSFSTFVGVVLLAIANNQDLERATRLTLFRLNALYIALDVKQFKPLPNFYITFTNGFYNFKKKKFIKLDSDDCRTLLNEYDLIITPNLYYHEVIDKEDNYYKVWNEFITSLANNKPDQLLLFKQMVCAAAEGYGRKQYIMMSGTAGSGKSTFGRILELIAGIQNVVYHTMDKFDDHNSLNCIGLTTKLIIGDDLQKSAKLVGEALRNYKSLVDGQPVSVNVKFEPNKIVRSLALWLQMMNDDPNFHETNDAVKGRTILVRIVGKNHRDTKDVSERALGKLLEEYTGKYGGEGDPEFLSTVISDCLNEIDYFDRFTVSDEMLADVNDMVDSGNWAKNFVDYLELEELTAFPKLFSNDLYVIFQDWLKDNNPSMSIPSFRKFNKELEPYMSKLGYSYDKTRAKINNKLLIYNRAAVMDQLGLNKYQFKQDIGNYWVSDKEFMPKDIEVIRQEIFALKDQNKTYDDLSFKQKIVAEHFISHYDADLIAWKNNVS